MPVRQCDPYASAQGRQSRPDYLWSRSQKDFWQNVKFHTLFPPLSGIVRSQVSIQLLQWCRSRSMARGALLIARLTRDFEVKSTYLYKKMIMLFSKQRSFTTLYLVIHGFRDSFLNLTYHSTTK